MNPKEEKSSYKVEPVTNCDRLDMPVRIESLIHIIRDQQVMLDSDLARLYGVETKVLNQAVKRNIQRFPEDFMFQLSKEECLRSQIDNCNCNHVLNKGSLLWIKAQHWGKSQNTYFRDNSIIRIL